MKPLTQAEIERVKKLILNTPGFDYATASAEDKALLDRFREQFAAQDTANAGLTTTTTEPSVLTYPQLDPRVAPPPEVPPPYTIPPGTHFDVSNPALDLTIGQTPGYVSESDSSYRSVVDPKLPTAEEYYRNLRPQDVLTVEQRDFLKNGGSYLDLPTKAPPTMNLDDVRKSIASGLSSVGHSIYDTFNPEPQWMPDVPAAKPATVEPQQAARGAPPEPGANRYEISPELGRFVDDQHRRDRETTPNGGPPYSTRVTRSTDTPSAGLAENAASSKAELNWIERQAELLGSDTPEKRQNLGNYLVGFGRSLSQSTAEGIGGLGEAFAAGNDARLLSQDRLRQVAEKDQELAWKKEQMDRQREEAANARTDRAKGLEALKTDPTMDPTSPFYGMSKEQYQRELAYFRAKQANENFSDPWTQWRLTGKYPTSTDALAGLIPPQGP